MPVTGDFEELKRFQNKIGKAIGVPEKIAPACSEKFAALTHGYFSGQVDPYGASWMPVKTTQTSRRTGKVYQRHDAGHPALVRTGTMNGTSRFRPYGANVKVDVGDPFYTRYQISAGKRWGYSREARRFMPKAGRLPPAWIDVLERETQKAFKQLFEGT